jgi:RNA recognition motif-containing protein
VVDIFVGNLPYEVRESDLRNVFERYGRVSSVRVVTDPSTNLCRGFAFIGMPSLDDADEALHQASGMTLGGRQLRVSACNDKRADGKPGAAGKNSERAKALKMFETLLKD